MLLRIYGIENYSIHRREVPRGALPGAYTLPNSVADPVNSVAVESIS